MSSPVTVNILGKEYQISCPENDKPSLIASAQMLNDSMEKIRATGKVVGLDRIAVMAALNFAHELLVLKNEMGQEGQEVDRKLSQLNEKVSAFLQEEGQLEL